MFRMLSSVTIGQSFTFKTELFQECSGGAYNKKGSPLGGLPSQ